MELLEPVDETEEGCELALEKLEAEFPRLLLDPAEKLLALWLIDTLERLVDGALINGLLVDGLLVVGILVLGRLVDGLLVVELLVVDALVDGLLVEVLLVGDEHTLPVTSGRAAGELATPLLPCTPNSMVWPGLIWLFQPTLVAV